MSEDFDQNNLLVLVIIVYKDSV